MLKSIAIALSILVVAAATLPAQAAVAPAPPSADGFLSFLSAAEGMPQSMTLPGAEVFFTSNSCTIIQECPWSPSISCSGTTCSSAQVYCSDGGSSCPMQGNVWVPAVRCNGVIVASCPCPEVCDG